MSITNLDELIDFGYIVMTRCASSPIIAALLTNVNPSYAEADDLVDRYIFGYDYVDEASEGVESYICIDVDVNSVPQRATMILDIYVNVISHKNHMKLDPVIFSKMKGYRRDNLMREIDVLLRDGSLFGIGKLNLIDTDTLTLPTKYTGKLLHYQSVTFNNRRELLVV